MNVPEARIPSTAYFVARLIAYQPILYAINALAWILYHSWPLTLGLLAKAFFDTLAGQEEAGLTLASIVALVLALGLTKVGIIFGAVLSGVHFGIRKEGLLRRNLIARILDRPGAMALPGSAGEAISTLRDDVGMMGLAADWAFDAFAGLIFAGGGIAILLWVDVRVTLLVFVPIVLVITIAHAARNRLERARERSRAATARVTGSLGEIF